MPRPPRADEKGAIYHALNRGNAREPIFFKEGDYYAFENLIADALEKFPIDLYAYQWMPNHWHLVLSPQEDGAMTAFIGWFTLTHTQRHHAHFQTAGHGHLYQGRYKSFPVENDDHFFVVGRYVERNALTAGLVERAEDYRWGSLYNWLGGKTPIQLSPWPVERLPNWVDRVNMALTDKELKQVRTSVRRGVPFGSPEWTDSTIKRLGLETTVRPRGRPKKFA